MEKNSKLRFLILLRFFVLPDPFSKNSHEICFSSLRAIQKLGIPLNFGHLSAKLDWQRNTE